LLLLLFFFPLKKNGHFNKKKLAKLKGNETWHIQIANF